MHAALFLSQLGTMKMIMNNNANVHRNKCCRQYRTSNALLLAPSALREVWYPKILGRDVWVREAPRYSA